MDRKKIKSDISPVGIRNKGVIFVKKLIYQRNNDGPYSLSMALFLITVFDNNPMLEIFIYWAMLHLPKLSMEQMLFSVNNCSLLGDFLK